jgi:hypothetical protein
MIQWAWSKANIQNQHNGPNLCKSKHSIEKCEEDKYFLWF